MNTYQRVGNPVEHTQHLYYIDSIRALAALFVVLCHAFFQPANGFYSGWVLNHLGLSYGHIAVDVFIVVSGFCLMLPVARKGDIMPPIRIFLRRRARRILPPYYAAIILTTLFIFIFAHHKTGTVWDNSLPFTWPMFGAHLLLVQDLPLAIRGGSINYPLWTIAVECQVYLFMPLLVLSLRRYGNLLTLAWAISFGFILHYGLFGKLDSAHPWYLGLFCLGAVAARLYVQNTVKHCNLWRTIGLLLWLGVFVVIFLKRSNFFYSNLVIFDNLIGFATAIFLILYLKEPTGFSRILVQLLSWKPLASIGIFSYSLYLVHAPLLHALDTLFVHILNNPRTEIRFLLLVGAIPLIVGCAYCFHILFEKPFMTPSRTKLGGLPPTISGAMPAQDG